MKKDEREMEKKEGALRTIWFFLSQYKIQFLFLVILAAFIGFLESLNLVIMYPILYYTVGGGANVAGNQFINFVNIVIKIIPIDDYLVKLCILFIMTAFLAFIAKIFYCFFSAKLISTAVIRAKQDIFNKCLNSDYQFFIDNKQGEILYDIYVAPRNIASILTILLSLTVELFLSVSVFILLITLSWKGAVLIILGGVGYYYLTKYLSLKIHYITGKKQLESAQKESVIINEVANGIKHIKVFETFPYWKNLYDKTLNAFWASYRKGYFWERFPETLIFLLLYLSIGSAVIFIKLQNPSNFLATIPLIGTFAFAIFMIMPKLSKFGSYRMSFMNMLPNIETIYNILKDTSYNKIKNGDKKFAGLNFGIEFKNVKFAHKNREILLNNVSFEIKKNKITAMAGPSGSGKSTIVNLLLRLHDANSGGVCIDDVNIKELDIFSFLKKVGFVSQDTFIYNASVSDNIAFGVEYAEQEIIEAAKLANADEFIQQLPEKYDTLVGDRGMKLSGGEKQRIAIARAMIRKPEILILDEATSSLDNISESVVQKAINKVSKNCTTFIIAHRLSTIQNADIIYVLEQGNVVESGTHKQLLNKRGKYWELYNIQKETRS